MHRPTILLLALVIVVALQGPFHWFNNPSAPDRLIGGPDSFMRLQRVLDLHQNGRWYDPSQQHTNAPYGETLHWTRPMDALLYAGAWIGSAFTDFKTALVLWGAAISPLLLLGSVLIWSWATRDLLDDTAYLLSVSMMVLAPQLDAAFRLGRPDHHSLIMFLFFGQLAVFIRTALGTAERRHAAVAGVLLGAAIWVSVESLGHLLLFAGALGLFWLWRGGEHVRTMAVYLASFAATTIAALVLERPPAEWFHVQYDRISIVHVVLALAGACGWAAVAFADRERRFPDHVKGRLAAAAAACAIPAAVMLVLFPKFFAGPFVDLESKAFDEWIAVIAEYQSLVPVDRHSTGMFFAHLGPAFIALAYIASRWRRAAPPERQLLLLLTLGILFYLPMAFDAIRWSMYVQAMVWLPWTLMIVALARSPWRLVLKRARLPVPAMIAPLLVVGPICTGVAILPTKDAEAAKGACDWPAVSEYLADVRRKEGVQLVFTHLFKGPEIVWRSGNAVVGAPYGNPRALADTNALFRARNDAEAQAIVRRRGVDLILICPSDGERRRYVPGPGVSLFTRLEDGDPPAWLTRVTLPAALAGGFRLYRVVR